jgi:hypothetical protein
VPTSRSHGDPPLSETYVHVGCMRSALVATHVDRLEPT